MKYKNIWILIIVFLISLAFTTDSSAIILQDYNHDNLVQPIPVDTNGNVIHYNNTVPAQNSNNNSNSTLTGVKFPAAPADKASAPSPAISTDHNEDKNTGPNILNWFIFFILGISAFIFWGYKRLK